MEAKTEIEIRLEGIVQFMRSQVIALSDALANANGEIAVLRARIAKAAANPETPLGE